MKRCFFLRIYGLLAKIYKTSLPVKEDFYMYLNMEDITGADYVHPKSICKGFKTKRLG